ncbi:MAG: response regulator [Leptolyngbyaceae cyanobacterium]
MRILLVDDDEALMETLAESLIQQRYAVDIAVNGEVAQEFQDLFAYDLIVLDRQLPDVEGISLCRRFRQQGVTCPILMLTAQDDSADKVQALDAGADDYVVKPFDFAELCARIRALLRRDSPSATSELRWDGLRLTPSTFEVFYDDHQIHTTPKEYALLELLLRHPTQVFSLDAIIEDIWSFEDPPGGEAVRTHIKGLRQKLKACGAPKHFIETVYGLGYRLHALAPAPPIAPPAPPPEVSRPTQADMVAMLAKAWETHRETMQERLQVLEAVAAAIATHTLNPDLRQAGYLQAHKLAGSLGCYGLSEGSRIARELEHLLAPEAVSDTIHAVPVAQLVDQLRQTLAAGSQPEPGGETIAPKSQLLLVSTPESFHQPAIAAALAAGLPSRVATTLTEAQQLFQAESPAGILLAVTATEFEAALAWLATVVTSTPKIAVLVMTDIRDFHQRLQLVQRGADILLPLTVTPEHAIATVQHLLQPTVAPLKVVVVDDDVQVLELLQTLLVPWGMQLTPLAHPAQIWETLERVQPHLLILDVEMPEVNGLELCQVLRADDQWRHLPILFLTVHEDAPTLQQAFQVGADDFIPKSTVTELPQRILHRLQ